MLNFWSQLKQTIVAKKKEKTTDFHETFKLKTT